MHCDKRRAAGLSVALSFLAGSIGCGQAEQPRAILVSDSAGIQIAQADWEAAPFAWSVDSVAEWSLGHRGEAAATLQLHDVRDAVLLGDGSLLIVEGSTQEIIWSDPRGEVVRRVGGFGDGPQQFRGASRVFDGGDGSYFVVDAARKRIVRLSAEGGWLEDGAFPPAVSAVLASHRTPDGTWYLLSSGRLEETGVARNSDGTAVGRVRRPRLVVLRTRLHDLEQVDTVTAVLGAESAAGTDMVGAVVLGATALLAGRAGGVWVGDTSQEEVRAWAGGTRPALHAAVSRPGVACMRRAADQDSRRLSERSTTARR